MAERTATEAIPRQSIAKRGSASSAVIAVSDADTRCLVSVERFAWPDLERPAAKVRAEQSQDGITWKLLCEFTADGNTIPFLGQIVQPSMSAQLQRGASRRIRVTVEALEAIETKVDVESFDSGEPLQPADTPHSAVYDATSSVNYSNVSSASWTHLGE